MDVLYQTLAGAIYSNGVNPYVQALFEDVDATGKLTYIHWHPVRSNLIDELFKKAKWKTIKTCQGHKGGIYSMAFSPDGTRIVSGSDDKTIKLWDTLTGECLHTLNEHTNWVMSVVFSPDGGCIVSGSVDNTIKLWGRAKPAYNISLTHCIEYIRTGINPVILDAVQAEPQ